MSVPLLPRHDEQPDRRYRRMLLDCEAREASLARRDMLFSLMRGVVFLIGAMVAAGCWVEEYSYWWTLPWVMVFFAMAAAHEGIVESRQRNRERRRMAARHLACLERDWSQVSVPEVEIPNCARTTADDLDLFSRGGLFPWLWHGATAAGRATLTSWLFRVPSTEVIRERQRLVAGLAGEFDWRMDFELAGRRLRDVPKATTRFVDWATGAKRWMSHPALVTWMMLVPFLWIGAAIVARWVEVPSSGWALGAAVLLVINLVLSVLYAGRAQQIFRQVTSDVQEVRRYMDLLALIACMPASVGTLRVDRREIRDVAKHGLRCLGRLERVLRVNNMRRDVFWGILYFVAQWFFLWDLHLLRWLEAWQGRWGHESPAWFAAIGELEALHSLATVAYDHPAWAFPDIDPALETFSATGLGHPLLTDAACVVNDVHIGPPGTFLLVTGSNMSGKSTLLRSVAANILLAQAGGVVCARHLAMPPVELGTSMRVRDSLAQGISFFYAELLRLRDIVQQATAARARGIRFLFLLDEILQGTNSRERQIAVAEVLAHLLAERAIGAISTHDLELAHVEQLRGACQAVHFRETLREELGKRTMTFDYRLRPGLCPTTNALILLDMVGLRPPQPHD